MARDAVLELTDQFAKSRKNDELSGNISAVIKRLCEPKYAQRITNRSMEAICDYLEWLLSNLPRGTPAPESEQMTLALLILKGEGAERLMHLSSLGLVLYHAARLHAGPATLARVCYVNGLIRARMGLMRAALALWWKAAEAVKEGQLHVYCFMQIAAHYEESKLHGKAWNYLSIVLPSADELPPPLRARLWAKAADCLSAMHRYEDAARFYELIAAMPEAAQMLPCSRHQIFTNLNAPARPMFESLQVEARVAADGARAIGRRTVGEIARSNYSHFRPDGPVTVQVDSPQGVVLHQASSYHELFDRLQRRAQQVATTRSSLTWRGSAAAYLRGWATLFEALVETGLQICLPHRALEGLETLKATTLLQRLAIALGPCPERVNADDWSRLEALLLRYRQAIEEEQPYGSAAANGSPGLTTEELERAIESLAGKLRRKHPALAPALSVFSGTRDLPGSAALAGLPPNTRIVEYFCGGSRGGCWVINPGRPDRPDWIDLPGLTQASVTTVAQEVVTALAAWKHARARSPRDIGISGPAVEDSITRIGTAIEAATDFVRNVAVGRLMSLFATEHVTHLVVIPHRALHILPFHAALERDVPAMAYAPSLRVLARLRRRPMTTIGRGVVVADSVPECPAQASCHYRRCWRLPAAHLEGRYVRDALQEAGVSVYAREGATVTAEWLEQTLPEADVFHLATHAVFDAADPAESGILLSPGPLNDGADDGDLPYLGHDGRRTVSGKAACSRLWTLRRLWKRLDLSRCQLAFLGGCETSVVHWQDALEEFLGLAGGFLQAGVPTVIGSLWEVSDMATLLCTRRFYRNLLGGSESPAAALVSAQSWLRMLTIEELLTNEADLIRSWYTLEFAKPVPSLEEALAAGLGFSTGVPVRPFANPFFWAAFRCIGLP